MAVIAYLPLITGAVSDHIDVIWLHQSITKIPPHIPAAIGGVILPEPGCGMKSPVVITRDPIKGSSRNILLWIGYIDRSLHDVPNGALGIFEICSGELHPINAVFLRMYLREIQLTVVDVNAASFARVEVER